MSRKAQDTFYLCETFDAPGSPDVHRCRSRSLEVHRLRRVLLASGSRRYRCPERLCIGAVVQGFGYCAHGLPRAVSRLCPVPAAEQWHAVPDRLNRQHRRGATGFISAAVAAGRVSLVNFTSTAFPATGNPIGATIPESFTPVWLSATESRSRTTWTWRPAIAFAANMVAAVIADPTGGGGLPRAFTGAGTALTKLPLSEAISGITASTLCPWLAVD